MRGSLKIGSIARIPIRVHWSFAFLLLLAFADNPHASGTQYLQLVGWIVALFVCVTIHELSHCAVARRRGLVVRDIILLPIGGVSQIEGLPSEDARTERDVAVVGPLTNFVLAAALFLVAWLTHGRIWPPALFAGSWFVRLAWLNIVLGAFNLLPALPMDGGRVLRALLASRGDQLKATRIAATVAMVLGAGMIAFGIGYDFWLVFIGAFVIMGAVTERRTAMVRASINDLRVGNVMTADPTSVLAEVTVGQLAPWLASFPGRAVPIVGPDGYVGIVAMEDLLQASPWTPVGDVADRTARVLEAAQPVYPDGISAFGSTPRLQLAVMDNGRVVGVLYRWSLQNLLRQQQTAGARPRTGSRAA